MTDELTDLTRIAEQAVGLGYDIVRNTTPADIRLKGDRDVVTDVDLTVEREVSEFLKRMTPRHASSARKRPPRLRPTGTRMCGHSTPWTALPTLPTGYRCAPYRLPWCVEANLSSPPSSPLVGLRYVASKGRGAFGNGVQLQASKATDLSGSIISIGDYAVGDQAATKNEYRIRLTTLPADRVERVRMFGSAALDLVWVAEGRTRSDDHCCQQAVGSGRRRANRSQVRSKSYGQQRRTTANIIERDNRFRPRA